MYAKDTSVAIVWSCVFKIDFAGVLVARADALAQNSTAKT